MKWAFFILFFCGKAFGFVLDNISAPELPEWGIFLPEDAFLGIKLGYQVDYARNQKFRKISDFSYLVQQGVATLNINNSVEGYFMLGEANIRFSGEKKNEFFGGVGGRAMIIFWNETTLGLDAKYQRTISASKFRFEGWQVGMGLSHRWRFFIPYIGGIYSEYRLHSRSNKFKNHDHLSLVLGATLSPRRMFSLTIEGRVFGEEAISGNFHIRF